ncbi:RNA polymerase sigma factor [Anaerovorax odorimutans]|uniref:RNA polymerase sigma factor n=1 Tax=Anaerovorax odorimutans TaxID=109327 RepID=A0ABT1RRU5_9FIRM|nr:RNA polymerase sigma factor [Anaerovorax odorimutans]MCQ4637887.1 RNA polymerase sigma factor [Anaerovorax odorimutans]
MAPSEFKTTGSLITALFERYKTNMQRVAHGILKNADEADDAVQDAMIKIIKNIHMVDDIDSRRCANFVYTIVKNTALDVFRKKQKEMGQMVTNDISDFVNIIGEEINFDVFEPDYGFSEGMQEYLSQLNEMDKDIICLRYGNDFSDEEIGRLLGMKPDAVRKRLSRARKHLAEIIEERGNANG